MSGQARLLGRAWRSPNHYVHRRSPGLRVSIPPNIGFLSPGYPWVTESMGPINPTFASIDDDRQAVPAFRTPIHNGSCLSIMRPWTLPQTTFVIFHVHFVCSCGVRHTSTGPRLSIRMRVGATREDNMRILLKAFKCEDGDTMNFCDEEGKEVLPAYYGLMKADGSFIHNVWVGVWRGDRQRQFIHRLDEDNAQRGWPVFEDPDNWWSDKCGPQFEKVLDEKKQCNCDRCMIEQEERHYSCGHYQQPDAVRFIPMPIVGLTHQLTKINDEKRSREKQARVLAGLPSKHRYASAAAKLRKMR